MTYGEMIQEIVDETKRADKAVQIGRCILEAIEHYKDLRFPSNLNRTTTFAGSVINAGYVDLPTDFVYDKQCVVEHGGSRTPLLKRSAEFIREQSGATTPAIGTPIYYAIDGRSLLLDPDPPDTHIIRLYYVANLAPPANQNDGSTFWTNDARLLIKYKAKALLFATHLYQPEQAAIHNQLAEGAIDGPPGGELRRLMGKVEMQVLADSPDPCLGGRG